MAGIYIFLDFSDRIFRAFFSPRTKRKKRGILFADFSQNGATVYGFILFYGAWASDVSESPSKDIFQTESVRLGDIDCHGD